MLSRLCTQTSTLLQTNLISTETHHEGLINTLQSELERLCHENLTLQQTHAQDQKELNDSKTKFMQDFHNLFAKFTDTIHDTRNSRHEAGMESLELQLAANEDILAKERKRIEQVKLEFRGINDGIDCISNDLIHSQKEMHHVIVILI